MLGDFIVFCDFDGTITEVDFYRMVMKYLTPEQQKLALDTYKNGGTVKGFLKYVFSNINQDKHVIDEEVRRIKFKKGFKELLKYVKENNGELIIISAGLTYYVKKSLQIRNIFDIQIYANRSHYRDKGLHFDENDNDFACEKFGIDKEKIVKKFKKYYAKSYYIADGFPDYKASLFTDEVFATGMLEQIYNREGKTYKPFNDFVEILEHIKNVQE